MDEHLSVITGYWKTINLPVRVLSYSLAAVVGNVLDENVHRSRYFTGIFINVNPCVTFYIFFSFSICLITTQQIIPLKTFFQRFVISCSADVFSISIARKLATFFLHHTHKSPNNLYIVPMTCLANVSYINKHKSINTADKKNNFVV